MSSPVRRFFNDTKWEKKQTKEAVGSAGRLLQYCQLPDKTSRDISLHIWKCLRYFKICIYLFHNVLWKPGWEKLGRD
jgi:hypothetical protein